MSEKSMNAMTTESVTEGVNTLMTKEEARSLRDDELIKMIEEAQGHTNDFRNYMKCDFTYPFLTGLLKDRGYAHGWYKSSVGSVRNQEPSIIKMKKSDVNSIRKSYIIDAAVAEEWKRFNENVPFPSVTLGSALRRFMDDYNAGLIKFELEI